MALRRATFRLYPTQKTNEILHYHRKLHKDLYNAAVYHRKTEYQKFCKSIKYLDQQNCLPAFKDQWTEYKHINSQALQATLKRVDFAFNRFFTGLAKYPKLKSIRHYSGWTYPSGTGWKVHSIGDNGYLELAKIGQIQMRGKARLWGNPKTCDLVYRHGKWYASLALEVDDELLKKSRQTNTGKIAIDLGCKDAIAWTNGDENGLIEAPRFLRKAEQQIKKLSKSKRRKQSPNYKKRQKASRRWKKAQSKVSKLCRQVANSRQNWVHQVTTQIISGNSMVVTEELEVKKMTSKAKTGKRKKQKAGLNKSILDVGMGMIRSALKYKLQDVQGVFLEVPTKKVKPSQTCPKCGHQEQKNLDQRVHICANCGYTQQRDIAAAEVMLVWSQNQLPGLGTSLADADGSSSTKKRRATGSLRQLSQVKRQKSQPAAGDVETPVSTK
ncbi:RNA-guided endonuclease InsQ/TnpB family protein [Anabaena azotica]|uniref:RNA-guided endonuclease InsQ/TnpB family protein n=1 Tax=Anabaena azotica TaxID=197653 RepID=UPI0039A6CB4A